MAKRLKGDTFGGRDRKLDLKGSEDYNNPSIRTGENRRARWVKNYPSGTLYEKQTGKYRGEEWNAIRDADTGEMPAGKPGSGSSGSAQKTKRPLAHGKKIGKGTATVTRGTEKPAGAQRGVGQESIDGFINGLMRRRRKK